MSFGARFIKEENSFDSKKFDGSDVFLFPRIDIRELLEINESTGLR